MAVLLNAMGQPEPSPDVQRRLRLVHPGLSLRYSQGLTPGSWMITMEWQRDDGRWEAVKRQELAPNAAFDVIGYLPVDCSPEQAPTYLERSLRTYPKEHVRKLVDRMSEYNASGTPAQAAVESAMGEVFAQGDPSETKRVTGKRTLHKPKD